jgi:hypothetical protein
MLRMQIVLIARETHWSRAEILALPAAEFKALAELLKPAPHG